MPLGSCGAVVGVESENWLFLWITTTALEALPFGVLQGLVGSSVSRCGGVRQCWEERVFSTCSLLPDL